MLLRCSWLVLGWWWKLAPAKFDNKPFSFFTVYWLLISCMHPTVGHGCGILCGIFSVCCHEWRLQKTFVADMKDAVLFSEKFINFRFRPSLSNYGGKAIDGFIAVTASGLVGRYHLLCWQRIVKMCHSESNRRWNCGNLRNICCILYLTSTSTQNLLFHLKIIRDLINALKN